MPAKFHRRLIAVEAGFDADIDVDAGFDTDFDADASFDVDFEEKLAQIIAQIATADHGALDHRR